MCSVAYIMLQLCCVCLLMLLNGFWSAESVHWCVSQSAELSIGCGVSSVACLIVSLHCLLYPSWYDSHTFCRTQHAAMLGTSSTVMSHLLMRWRHLLFNHPNAFSTTIRDCEILLLYVFMSSFSQVCGNGFINHDLSGYAASPIIYGGTRTLNLDLLDGKTTPAAACL